MAATISSPVNHKARHRSPPNYRGRSLGLPDFSTFQWVRQVRDGIPYAALLRFQKNSGLGASRIADLIRIPQRTLMRRKAVGRLRTDESERLLRVSGVFDKALELFEGDAQAARRWLTTPSESLESHSPLDLAATEIGAREVEDLVGRLEYGAFS